MDLSVTNTCAERTYIQFHIFLFIFSSSYLFYSCSTYFFVKNELILLLPDAALALAFSFADIDVLLILRSILPPLKSRAPFFIGSRSTSVFSFFVSPGLTQLVLRRLLPDKLCTELSSGRPNCLRSFLLKSSIKYSDTIPWAYRKYDSSN